MVVDDEILGCEEFGDYVLGGFFYFGFRCDYEGVVFVDCLGFRGFV